MRPIARSLPRCLAVTLFLGCAVDPASAPDLGIAFNRSGSGGNPDCQVAGHAHSSKNTPVDFVCAIRVPGPNPLTSSQKGWVEQSNGRYFLSDASNFGVDVLDIGTHTFVGRVGGMVGNVGTGGGTAASNGAGPNAIVSAPAPGGRVLFVSDGNSTVHVVDMDELTIIASISTAKADCDGGTATTHYCGRSNEIAYDPVHHVVAVSNPNPLALAEPHGALEGYLTFFSARAPYAVLGHLSFGPGTVEGHVWVPQLNRFLLPMQNPPGGPFIAVVNAGTMQEETRRLYDCATIPGAVPTSGGNNNLQVGPGDNLWAQLCGRPIQLDIRTGAIVNVVEDISTGDEDWYNPGDGAFYVTGTPIGGVASLGVADARTGTLLQAVPNIGGASPTVYAKTNEIFTRATVNANSRCVEADRSQGCVVVFAHVGSENDD